MSVAQGVSGGAPQWLERLLRGRKSKNRAAERRIIREADSLTFSELVELLHARVGVEPPSWWQRWRRGDRGPVEELEAQIERHVSTVIDR